MVVHQICDASLRGSLICKIAKMLICTLLQRRRNELKVGGAEHTSAKGASSVEGSGGILPREILKTRTPEMPFWALNLEFILIAKMS